MNMRMTRRGAGILIALMLVAVPAAAAVVTQNFETANVEVNGPCFFVEAGADVASATGFVDFQSGTVSTGSVDLFQESVTVTGNGGNRMIYSDVAQYTNNCGDTATMQFLPAADPAGGPAFFPDSSDPIWDDFTISFFVANTDTPGDVLTSGDWEELLTVDGGSATTPDAVTLFNGSTRALAVVIDTDASVVNPLPETAVLRWTAQVQHS